MRKKNAASAPRVADPIMTEAEAAAYLGTPRATLSHWRLEGRGPDYYRMGRSIRYRRSGLDDFLAACAVKPAPVYGRRYG